MMMARRDAVTSFLLFADLLASAMRVDAQPQAAVPAPPTPVFKHGLGNLTIDDWEVTVSSVDCAPGV